MRCAKANDKLTDDLLPGVLPGPLAKFFGRREFPLLDSSDGIWRYDVTTPDNRFPLALEVPLCEHCR